MNQWIQVAVVAASAGCLLTLLLVLLWRWYHHKERRNFVEPNSLTTTQSIEEGIAKLHRISGRSLFNWSDHPSLATDAVENGWSRFAFTSYKSSSPSKKPATALLGACAAGDRGRETGAEISWEVCQESSDFMQKVRLNSGLKIVYHNIPATSVASVTRTALPLPGPPLGNCSFPQEAYFEITILHSCIDDCESVGKDTEGEKTKLIQDDPNSKGNSEAHRVNSRSHRVNSIEELKLCGKDSGKRESVMFSLGLTAAGSLPLTTPGSYPRSIGFNSNGSVFLDGTKLIFESEEADWISRDKVIGCGYDPRQKMVYFTLDSELVHVFHCQSEEFGTPLFPTMASNIDMSVLVNFGQSPFKYGPANAQRTPNPCFTVPIANSGGATLGYEDSKELFSIGRIDSQWLYRSTAKGSQNNGINNQVVDFDEEFEADFFEIVLDGSQNSPNTAS